MFNAVFKIFSFRGNITAIGRPTYHAFPWFFASHWLLLKISFVQAMDSGDRGMNRVAMTVREYWPSRGSKHLNPPPPPPPIRKSRTLPSEPQFPAFSPFSKIFSKTTIIRVVKNLDCMGKKKSPRMAARHFEVTNF